MKRVLCILSNMNAGGAETFLMKIYRQIDRDLYQMDFCINTKEKCFYENEIQSLGGKIYRIPAKSENLKEFKNQLFHIVADNKYKYVLRVASNGASLMDIKIAKKAGAEVCAVRSSNSSDGSSLKAKVAHYFGRWIYGKYADVKFAPSDLAAMYTFGEKAFRKGDVSILHNAIDLKQYTYNENERQKVRDEFGIKDDELLVGHIGRFMKQKNHEFLVDVFQELHRHNKKAKLFLVGDGELKADIESKICLNELEKYVFFLGTRSDMPQILCAIDVLLFPSLYEGMPNVVIESQATGLPCVISDTITKSANITGLVDYVSLNESITTWVEAIYNAASKGRVDTRDAFMKNKYDIQSTAEEFIRLVFR